MLLYSFNVSWQSFPRDPNVNVRQFSTPGTLGSRFASRIRGTHFIPWARAGTRKKSDIYIILSRTESFLNHRKWVVPENTDEVNKEEIMRWRTFLILNRWYVTWNNVRKNIKWNIFYHNKRTNWYFIETRRFIIKNLFLRCYLCYSTCNILLKCKIWSIELHQELRQASHCFKKWTRSSI